MVVGKSLTTDQLQRSLGSWQYTYYPTYYKMAQCSSALLLFINLNLTISSSLPLCNILNQPLLQLPLHSLPSISLCLCQPCPITQQLTSRSIIIPNLLY